MAKEIGKLNGLDLFSGIGGMSTALEPWVLPIAYCENDRYVQAVLLSRMRWGDLPCAPIWDDVCSLSKRVLPATIDIIYGGFPCQDISVAGNGRGLAGERSGLVFELLRLVKECSPSYVFLENVPAIRTRGGERVAKELARQGFDCRWDVVSAEEIGAPHKRERWFLLAHLNRARLQKSGHHEIAARKGNSPLANGDAGLSDASEASLFARRIPPQFRLQESFWSEDAANLGRIHDGVPPVVHRIRALGNAVVPLQAREAFKRLMGL